MRFPGVYRNISLWWGGVDEGWEWQKRGEGERGRRRMGEMGQYWKPLNGRQKRVIMNSNSTALERFNFGGFILLLLKERNTDGKHLFCFWSTTVVVWRRLAPGHSEGVDRVRDFSSMVVTQLLKYGSTHRVTTGLWKIFSPACEMKGR